MSPEEAMTQVIEAFPHGARAVTEGREGRTISLVGLEARDLDGTPTLLGWAYPNKDFYFSLKKVEIRDDGWLLTDGATRTLLQPLTAKQGNDINSMMENV